MTNIVERIPGYDNKSMIDYCETLKRIVTKTKEFKSGSGKSATIKVAPKYREDKEMLQKLNSSIEHYSKSSVEFRDYQKEIISNGVDILNKNKFLYLAMEVRTGKTLTSLGIASEVNAKTVLFVTKKKAISSIEDDYKMLSPDYEITIINYESLHIVMNDKRWDLMVLDEAHSCFLGNTLIDGVKIKDIKIGDSLKSFNFDTNEYEHKKVTNVFKNDLTENLIKIKCNGKEIVCTESHEIYTKRGWIKARDITTEDELQVV